MLRCRSDCRPFCVRTCSPQETRCRRRRRRPHHEGAKDGCLPESQGRTRQEGPQGTSASAPLCLRVRLPARAHRKCGTQANLAASAFKESALPLHVNITHTPPVLADDGTVSVASADPGFVGTTTLLPGTFATGSYGWKGNKRFTVEIDNPDGSGKEKVHVMLT